MDKRRGRVRWGPKGTRSVTSDAYWRGPLKWNEKAASAAERPRVFCASLADVFEDWDGPIVDHNGITIDALMMHDLRARLFRLIDSTPNLDWMLLTKRPENILKMWPADGKHRSNVWLGTSCGDQESANTALPFLVECQPLSPVLFASCEPLLEYIDLSPWTSSAPSLDMVILGGESGPGARECYVEWIRMMIRRLRENHTSIFVKQLGANAIDVFGDPFLLKHSKGGDMDEWPEGIRIQEIPEGGQECQA